MLRVIQKYHSLALKGEKIDRATIQPKESLVNGKDAHHEQPEPTGEDEHYEPEDQNPEASSKSQASGGASKPALGPSFPAAAAMPQLLVNSSMNS